MFISAGVARLMRATADFPWLPKAVDSSSALPVLYRDGACTVYAHLHFSNYGKFQRRLDEECLAIAALIPPDT